MFTRSIRLLGGHLLADGREPVTKHPKRTEVFSLRVNSAQASSIAVAASAAHLSRSEYLYRRVTDKAIISTPALAALAELISLLHRLESLSDVDTALLTKLRDLVLMLCQASDEQERET